MKFTQILIPLASAALVMAQVEEAEVGYAAPVKFNDDGLANVLKVASKDPSANASDAVRQAIAFLGRNPNIKKSIGEIVKDPKNKKAVAKGGELIRMILSVNKGPRINIYKAKIQTLEFTYANPDFFEFTLSVAKNVIKKNPTLLNDFFATLKRLVKADPELFGQLRQALTDFSHDDEQAYKKGFELLLKASLSDVDFSSAALVHIVELDKIACGQESKSIDQAPASEDEAEVELPTTETFVETEEVETHEVSEPETEITTEAEEPVSEEEETSTETAEEIDKPEVPASKGSMVPEVIQEPIAYKRPSTTS